MAKYKSLIPMEIITTGNKWLAINKPAGIGVEKHFDHDTVEKRALEQFKRPGASKPPFVGIVHRLDRPVSGVLLLARNKSMLVALNQLFAERKLTKIYHAWVGDAPAAASGRLRHFLRRDNTNRKAIASTRPIPGAKEAILDYKLLEEKDGRYLLEVKPISGKFHQIRVQLSSMGCPIIGDALYGSLQPYRDNEIMLHARELYFIPPSEVEKIRVEAAYPEAWNT